MMNLPYGDKNYLKSYDLDFFGLHFSWKCLFFEANNYYSLVLGILYLNRLEIPVVDLKILGAVDIKI